MPLYKTDMKTKPLKSEIFSPVKWQREQKKMKISRLASDRATLPVLTREEIIAYRLPFHEAIIRKLRKNGFENSAEYLRQLMSFQDEYRNAAGEESIIWQWPRLLYQQNVLEHLANGLQSAEEAHFAKKIDAEIDRVLKMAVEYCFGSENWWWLGHQLLFMALKTSEEYDADRCKRKALVKYVFGRFLFENAKEPKLALEHLKIARKITDGMTWSTNMAFHDLNNTIFAETCKLIHKILMMQAKSAMQKDPQGTILLCDKAKRRAMEGSFYEGIVDSNLTKGNCLMMLFDTDSAIKICLRAMSVLEKHPHVELMCETLKNLAMAYLRHGTFNSALITLNKLKEYSKRNNKPQYFAHAHKYLGEFYLKEGTARKATPLLMKAVRLFDKMGDSVEIAKSRNLAAISVGIEFMPAFSNIVRDGDPKFSTDHANILRRLIRWKDSREAFWLDNELSYCSKVSANTLETLSTYSSEHTGNELQELDEFLEREELLGVTGLEGEYSMHMSLGSPTNRTDSFSIPGVEQSGNTLLPPNFEEENFSNAIAYQSNSLCAYVMPDKGERNSEYSDMLEKKKWK